MRVDDIRVVDLGDRWELSGRVTMQRLDTGGLRLWFRCPRGFSDGAVDASPFVPGLLATSMWWQERLEIEGPVSPRMLARAIDASWLRPWRAPRSAAP